jgi:ParB family chromosome partitioning protein
VFIHSEGTSDSYDQMIEKLQRDDLSAADIAAFIVSRLEAGVKQKDIALRLGKDKSYIAMYASVAKMAPVLRERLAASPIRAVYELHQMWKKFPQAVEAFCAEHDSFTCAQAIAFCEGLTSRPRGSMTLHRTRRRLAQIPAARLRRAPNEKRRMFPGGRNLPVQSARTVRMRSR